VCEIRVTTKPVVPDVWVEPRPRKRGNVVFMSHQSRINLRRAALRFPWDELGRVALVTVTYQKRHGEKGEFPMDGKVVKAHARTLWKRFERRYGVRPRGIWIIEFQERGAPHYHIFMEIPEAEADEDPYDSFRWWALNAWSDLLMDSGWGFDERAHSGNRSARVNAMEMGTRVNVSPAWYTAELAAAEVAQYLYRHAEKVGQKVVPDGFVNVGHFWGVLGVPRGRNEYEVCCAQAGKLISRVLRELAVRRERREQVLVRAYYQRRVARGSWPRFPRTLLVL